MKKSKVLTVTTVKERLTAGIKAVSTKKAFVLESKKIRKVKRQKSKSYISHNKSSSWIDNFDADEPVYNSSSDSRMDVVHIHPTSNFKFVFKKIKASGYILVELESKGFLLIKSSLSKK